MKRIASTVAVIAALAPSACKHKDNAPPLAGSASAVGPLPGVNVPSTAESTAPGVSDFEGEIGLLAKGKFSGGDGTPLSLTLRVKGGKLRVDVPEAITNAHGFGPAYLLVQPAEKKTYAILDAKKQAVLLEFDKLAQQAKGFGAAQGGNPSKAGVAAPRLEKTGKFDTVVGTKCEIWRFSQEKTSGEACIAEQATPWFHVPTVPQAAAEMPWVSEIADGKHLPLRFVSTAKNGEEGRIEVTSIQQKALPTSLFELPPDYAVLSIEQMMASLMGGLGGTRLPPGVRIPSGAKLPPGFKLPPGVAPPK